MNYATIKKVDVANGPGVRVSLYVSGCTHHCKGCFNQETWDFAYGKPFTQAQFNKSLERALGFIRQRNSAKVIFRLVGGGVRVEEIAQILFLESHGHVMEVFLADGSTLETRKSAQDMKADLDKIAPGQFVSPNKGYLVNLAAIHMIKTDYVEIQGHQIPLGKRKYRDFQEQYFQFMFAG